MQKSTVLVGVYIMLCAGPASAAPVMPDMPNIAYLFDTVSAGTTPNFVSGGPAGTLVSAPQLVADTPFAYAGNKSLDFDGLDDHIQVANDSSFNITGDITISIWVKMASDAEVGGLIGKTNALASPNTQTDYSMFVNPAGTLRHYTDSIGSAAVSDLSVGSTVWEHLVVSRSGATVSFYKNGVAGTPVGSYGTAYPNRALPLLIAVVYKVAPHYFDGLIDEPAIWDRALSPNEIQWLSQNSISNIPEPATVFIMALGTCGLLLLRNATGRRRR